jgi:ferric-dicitrate binding protein FerR (iron transport regulator)
MSDEDRYLWEARGQPDPEIERLEEALRPLRYSRPAPELPAHRPWHVRRPIQLAAAAAVVLIAGAFWVTLRDGAGEAWSVKRLAGVSTIDERTLGAAGNLGVGEWLETSDSGSARVRVADIGTVTVHPASRMRLLASDPRKEHRLELVRGHIDALITAPPRLFFVDTPSATAVDMGCAYDLVVADDGSGELTVTMGLVDLEHEGMTSTVPEGAACRMRPGIGPGTPFFADADPDFVVALASLDFEAGGAAALAAVLDGARPRDTLTLWHLLARVEVALRGRIFDRLAELSPPPPAVGRNAILQGDPAALKTWWRELELAW